MTYTIQIAGHQVAYGRLRYWTKWALSTHPMCWVSDTPYGLQLSHKPELPPSHHKQLVPSSPNNGRGSHHFQVGLTVEVQRQVNPRIGKKLIWKSPLKLNKNNFFVQCFKENILKEHPKRNFCTQRFFLTRIISDEKVSPKLNSLIQR